MHRLILLLLLLGGIAPLAAQMAAASPAAQPTCATRIAFASNSEGNYHIYTMNPDGGDVQALTSGGSFNSAPDWSPDGTRIAFTSDREGSTDLYVMNADGSNLQRLTDYPAEEFQPAWSPDGTQIAFVSDLDSVEREIYVMDADGSNLRRLTDNDAAEFAPAWSPDGTQITFTSGRDANEDRELYIMDADGGSQTRLTVHEGGDSAGVFSPDGTRIAYNEFDGDTWNIVVINADGSGRRQLTDNPDAQDFQPDWSPDGAQILFMRRDSAATEELWIMDADGANAAQITFNGVSSLFADWSPCLDGSAPVVVTTPADQCKLNAPQVVELFGEPDFNSSTVGMLRAGQSAYVSGQYTTSQNNRWWRLLDGAWVPDAMVFSAGNCAAVPPVSP